MNIVQQVVKRARIKAKARVPRVPRVQKVKNVKNGPRKKAKSKAVRTAWDFDRLPRRWTWSQQVEKLQLKAG